MCMSSGLRIAACAATMVACCGYVAAEVQLHVSAEGKDDNSGSLEAPLETLDRARDLLRELRTANPDTESNAAIVWIHAGEYERQAPFLLEAQDSNTEWRAMPGAVPHILGGRVLPPEAFAPVTDVSLLQRIDPIAHRSVLWADLKTLGITEFGAFPDTFTTPPSVPELFFNGTRMTLARWPNNDEWATVAKVVDSGSAPWRNHESTDTGTFEYSGDRPARWIAAPGVWLYGYWCFDWASETIRVKSIDTSQSRISLVKPHVYGIGSGNPAERRFCALNLLEELDAPGEYYLDRENAQLFFWPPASLTPGSVVLSLLQESVMHINDATQITVSRLTVSCCAGVGIQVEGGGQVRLEACAVRNTGLDGVVVKGGVNHRVEACDISEIGTGGLVIEGGDRKTLTPCGHAATNNDIWNIGRRKRTHAYNVHLGGVGVRLAHNRIHHAPHQAIGLGGNDHLVEFNEIFDICQGSDDCGAFYMGRDPSERGTILRYNFWRDTGGPRSHGSCAVYFDDGAGGQLVYGNVFLRAAGGNFGAVFVHGGHNNRVYNNIFVDCKAAMRHVRWNDNYWMEWINGDLWKERLLNEVDVTRAPYRHRYSELTGFFEFRGEPRTNYAAGNVAVRCPMFCDGDWEQENNFATEDDPGFMDAAAMNFQLRDDSEIYERIPGFERIPFEEIGMQRSSAKQQQ